MNKKIVHDALILTAFTLVLGFLLGVVYDITKEPIAAAEKAALDEAYKVVFADAASFEEDESFDAAKAAEIIAAKRSSIGSTLSCARVISRPTETNAKRGRTPCGSCGRTKIHRSTARKK